ncbi:MAG: transcriptional regulator, TetR family [Akkermansiaceae bacterium]|nr:transcriptional regulator, TetR family [Akkermansiaceae bacterium]
MKTHISSQDIPETKRKLLNAGIELMRMKGFNATSVAEICEAAGTTKGGFFHYFPSKEDLTKEAAFLFREEKMKSYEEAGFLSLPDPLDRVMSRLEFLKSSERLHNIYSCLIGTLAQELSTTHPDLREIFQGAFAKMTKDLELDLEAAKALYAPEAVFDPRSLASMFISMFQGAILIAKAADSNEVVVDNIESFITCLRSFFPEAAFRKVKTRRKPAIASGKPAIAAS